MLEGIAAAAGMLVGVLFSPEVWIAAWVVVFLGGNVRNFVLSYVGVALLMIVSLALLLPHYNLRAAIAQVVMVLVVSLIGGLVRMRLSPQPRRRGFQG